MTWGIAALACFASFVGFSIVIVFGRESDVRRASWAMVISGTMAITCLLMVATK